MDNGPSPLVFHDKSLDNACSRQREAWHPILRSTLMHQFGDINDETDSHSMDSGP